MTYARRPAAGTPFESSTPITSTNPINSGAVIGAENKRRTQ